MLYLNLVCADCKALWITKGKALYKCLFFFLLLLLSFLFLFLVFVFPGEVNTHLATINYKRGGMEHLYVIKQSSGGMFSKD